MFHEGDLQSGIAAAVQHSKAVLCFVHDDSDVSHEWEKTMTNDDNLRSEITKHAVPLRLLAGSQEAGFLSPFVPMKDIPTIVVIRNGTVQLHAHAAQPDGGRIKDRLLLLFDSTTTNVPLANNINAATPDAPSSPIPSGVGNGHATPIAQAPAAVSNDLDSTALRSATAATAPLPAIPEQLPSAQQSQHTDYMKMQKERERKAKEERERIKQQIKADREERRRVDQLRKQQESASEPGIPANLGSKPKSTQIRVQVRTFDGSTLRESFEPSSTIAKNIRPWVDATWQQTAPYDLKLILTPMPNRNIEAVEEEQTLPDLGIKGSCTLVMVPVRGYVDSYTGSGPATLVTSAVSGGYNLLSGTAGALFGSVRSVLGYGASGESSHTSSAENRAAADTVGVLPNQVRVRSLADQRAEAAERDQQFYNGNSTNFQPRKDDHKKE